MRNYGSRPFRISVKVIASAIDTSRGIAELKLKSELKQNDRLRIVQNVLVDCEALKRRNYSLKSNIYKNNDVMIRDENNVKEMTVLASSTKNGYV
ncbi:unnamed protein product [Dovyalis caffra]|uniref:Uncharacterized protein n=1 Tax=Dovyalis caffra TaxID=77055 RepID=A0AAV1S543_9ROSI|nr:unnamed protein product [Dovyalis caffra]